MAGPGFEVQAARDGAAGLDRPKPALVQQGGEARRPPGRAMAQRAFQLRAQLAFGDGQDGWEIRRPGRAQPEGPAQRSPWQKRWMRVQASVSVASSVA